MKERILITGASGFVGYHLILEALNNDLDVFAAVRKTSKTDHLTHLNIKYVFLDFNDVDALKNDISLNKYTYIIHAAGITRARSVEEYNHVNAGYTYNLALAMQEADYQVKRLVLISSLAAVGPLNDLTQVITEDTSPDPVTAYGSSKLKAEENLKCFSSLNYNILRPTGVYGPRDKDIFIFFKQVAKGIEPYIGNIGQKFSFIYVSDLAKAAILALKSPVSQATYNLSDGNCYNRYELGSNIKDALSVKTLKFHLPVNFVRFIAKLAEKYSALKNEAAVLNVEKLNELMAVSWFCNIGKARVELGFNPIYDLAAGVKESVNWYKANKWL